MSRIRRVLAAVDYSTPGRGAFDRALALSRAHDAELTVVHAVPSERPFNWDARERIALIETLRRAATAAGVRVTISVQSGDPAGVILLHAKAREADLIVLGSSERTGFDRFRFGSVAETVALEATQPVLVVPPVSGKTDSVEPITSILVAVDFGEGSRTAVETALSIASERTRVTLVHVVPGMPHGGASRHMYKLMEPEYHRQLARDAWRKLPAIIPEAARTSRNIRTRVVTGDPAEEISRVASDVGADLVLVGVTQRGAIGRAVFGSTAVRVIRKVSRLILAVPHTVGTASADAAAAARAA